MVISASCILGKLFHPAKIFKYTAAYLQPDFLCMGRALFRIPDDSFDFCKLDGRKRNISVSNV